MFLAILIALGVWTVLSFVGFIGLMMAHEKYAIDTDWLFDRYERTMMWLLLPVVLVFLFASYYEGGPEKGDMTLTSLVTFLFGGEKEFL